MALHHLDQLLQRRPDDGNALLRRMHQRLIAEDFLRATEDMRRAEGLLGKTQVSLWRRHHESLSLFREQTGPACWYAAGNREETRPAPK